MIWLAGVPQTAESLGKMTQAFHARPTRDSVIRGLTVAIHKSVMRTDANRSSD
jgi:hypothetical protein